MVKKLFLARPHTSLPIWSPSSSLFFSLKLSIIQKKQRKTRARFAGGMSPARGQNMKFKPFTTRLGLSTGSSPTRHRSKPASRAANMSGLTHTQVYWLRVLRVLEFLCSICFENFVFHYYCNIIKRKLCENEIDKKSNKCYKRVIK